MEETFERIRGQINSKLDNQKQVAIMLQAVEEALDQQNQEKIPAAYFALLLTLVEQDEGKARPSIMYLLNVVIPEVPEKLLRAKFDIIAKIYFLVIDEETENAPLMKAVLGCLEYTVISQERTGWSQPILKRTFQALLAFSIDPRPKVRRKAHESICNILATDVPKIVAKMTSEFSLNQLKKYRKVSNNTISNEVAPFLAFIKSVATFWAPEDLLKLNEQLMSLPKLNNGFVTTQVYEIFTAIISQIEPSKLESIMNSIVLSKPNINETKSMIAWLVSLKEGYSQMISADQNQFYAVVPTLLTTLFKDLEGIDTKVNQQIGATISGIVSSYNVAVAGGIEKDQLEITENMFSFIQNALSYRFRSVWPIIFLILDSFYLVFGKHEPSLLISSIKILDSMRSEQGFEYKQQLDHLLGSAISRMGPRLFLSILPLNLENPGTKTVGRAWLLPVLKDSIENTEFGFFANELKNLADRLDVKSKSFEDQGKHIEGKVYATLSQQIWSLFPSFAIYPHGLQESFDVNLAESIVNKIQTVPELQPPMLNGLALLVEYNRRLVPENQLMEQDDIEIALENNDLALATCVANLEHLAKFSTPFLEVFFNIHATASPSLRAMTLRVTQTLLTITPAEQINLTFTKLVSVLGDIASGENEGQLDLQAIISMLDLANVMIPYLSYDNVSAFFDITLNLINPDQEGGVQKRAYKALVQMLGDENQDSLVRSVALSKLDSAEAKFIEAGLNVANAAIKDRLNFLKRYVDALPSSHLHIISALTSEAILGTKELNEKAREAAFDLLIVMGNKMAQGGTIDSSRLNSEQSGIVEANLKEYVMMVVAGLTGTTPHMISATISALSRIIFEFHTKLEFDLIDDIIQTMELFVANTNREIVKSSLGFVKVITVTLEVDTLRPHLGMLVNHILKWSNDNKNRFKVKVRHIVERLIRRFSLEEVQGVFPEQHAKLIQNIKKRKLRAKRKKAANDGTQKEGDKPEQGKATLGNAFEDALYGSESEIEDDDDEDETDKPAPRTATKRKAQAVETYIKEDGLTEAPMDFLDRKAISRITITKPTNRPIGAQQAKLNSAFKTDSAGKLVFAEDSDSDGEAKPANQDDDKMGDDEADGEDYYKQAIESKDGFDRGQGNKIKFKRQRGNPKENDDFKDDDISNRNRKPNQRGPNQNKRDVGSDYKSKKASGDVKKKNQLDPFAYIPLNPKMASKKGKKNDKVNILKR